MPLCHVKAVQDDIFAKNFSIWLHHTVFIVKKDKCTSYTIELTFLRKCSLLSLDPLMVRLGTIHLSSTPILLYKTIWFTAVDKIAKSLNSTLKNLGAFPSHAWETLYGKKKPQRLDAVWKNMIMTGRNTVPALCKCPLDKSPSSGNSLLSLMMLFYCKSLLFSLIGISKTVSVEFFF